MRKRRSTKRELGVVSQQVADASAGAIDAMTEVGRRAAANAAPATRASMRAAGDMAAGAIEGAMDAARRIGQALSDAVGSAAETAAQTLAQTSSVVRPRARRGKTTAKRVGRKTRRAA